MKKQAEGHTAKLSKVMTCTCEHKVQDVIHGHGKRVMNPTKDGYRCTVCGRKHPK